MTNRKTPYTMQRGMVDYFMNLLNLPRGEVWSAIKEACNKCVNRQIEDYIVEKILLQVED